RAQCRQIAADAPRRGGRRDARDGGPPRRSRAADARALQRALPDALDTLALCLRAGLSLHAAVAEYARSATGVAGQAFRGYLAELAVGRTPEEALADLARRFPGDEVAGMAAAVAQSLRIGAPLADVFEAQAAHARSVALHGAREAAQKLSTHLVLPLVLFFFPVVFLIGLGPVAIKVAQLLGLLP
ncbi:MAG TPA: type II secretion system F family protein, partial [bacterium]|nr:type II secretion system F family protein [bacterium]